MKKIYALLGAIVLAFGANAQEDLAVSLDNYVNGATVSANPLDMSFTLTNNGATIPAGDTLVVGYVFNSSYHTVTTLQAGFVSLYVLQADMLNGDSQSISATTLTMQEVYDTLSPNNEGNLSGDFCIVALGLGSAALSNPVGNDVTPIDNQACVTYQVTEVVGLDENTANEIVAYPNPVSSVLTVNLGNANANAINVIDMSGRVVETVNVNNQLQTIDVSNYDNGVYFYQVVTNEGVIKTEKFVVSK